MRKSIVTICLIIAALWLFSGCGFYCLGGGSGNVDDIEAQVLKNGRSLNRIEDNQLEMIQLLKDREEDPC